MNHQQKLLLIIGLISSLSFFVGTKSFFMALSWAAMLLYFYLLYGGKF